jgi:hypothetical protein
VSGFVSSHKDLSLINLALPEDNCLKQAICQNKRRCLFYEKGSDKEDSGQKRQPQSAVRSKMHFAMHRLEPKFALYLINERASGGNGVGPRKLQ